MHSYWIFGAILRSAIPLPDLTPAADGEPRWTFVRAPERANPDEGVELGSDLVNDDVRVRLVRRSSTYGVVFDDTGVFEVDPRGREIRWSPGPEEPDLDSVRKDLTSRVLSVALHLQGIPTLHGSAVALDGTAVAFVAPKMHGKSTVAGALVRSGARLLADDTVAVDPKPRPSVLPEMPRLQLWPDAASHLSTSDVDLPRDGTPRKLLVREPLTGHDASAPVPLGAVYFLSALPAGDDTRTTRVRLSGIKAALVLLGQAKIGRLLGEDAFDSLVPRLVELENRVPLYALRFPRGLDRLDDTVELFWSWHAAGPEAACAGSGS